MRATHLAGEAPLPCVMLARLNSVVKTYRYRTSAALGKMPVAGDWKRRGHADRASGHPDGISGYDQGQPSRGHQGRHRRGLRSRPEGAVSRDPQMDLRV